MGIQQPPILGSASSGPHAILMALGRQTHVQTGKKASPPKWAPFKVKGLFSQPIHE